jgi:iron complex outermembrane receptor protein
LNYNNASKKSKHLVDVTLGYTAQDWFTYSPNLPVYSYDQDTIIVPANPNPFDTRNALLSYFGRAIYTYDNRFVANVSMRRDGSSRFSSQTRWGTFPSAAAAWIISNEKFMEKQKLVNMLKVRAGWGVTGQQDGIGDYAYIGNYYPGALTAQYAFGGQFYTVFRPDGFDANLKWETTSSLNLGVDFGFLNDRINGTIDVYRKDTRDLLAVVPVPAGSNFTNQILTNVGSMRNEGIEITTSFGLIAKKDMRLNLGANATYNRNTVLKLSQIEDPNSPGVLVGGIAGGIGNTIQVHQLGFPTFSYLVYEQQYDANGNQIEVGAANPNGGEYEEIDAFVDRNGDGIINIDDRYIFPQAAPLWFLGLSLDFTYKRWFAGLSMRSELGGYLYNNIHSNNGTFQAVNGTQGFLNNLSTLYFDEELQTTTERQLLSDHYIERADFLRLDYVNVGYDFGRIKKMKDYVGLRAGITVSNVLVLTKYKGLDPEINGGIDNNIYPRPRVLTLNLTFNF